MTTSFFSRRHSPARLLLLPAAWIGASVLAAPDVPCGSLGIATAGQRLVDHLDPSTWSTATDYAQLRALLRSGRPFIYIPPGSVIRIPNRRGALVIGPGQQVFSTRRSEDVASGDAGARLVVARNENLSPDNYPVILMDSDSRLSGLVIQGPDRSTTSIKQTIGIQTVSGSRNIRIDDNELHGWPWAAVSAKSSRGVRVDHNYIHHNLRRHLGYGVVLQNGRASAHIDCNVFDANRHAIASSGRAGESYVAEHNLVMQGGGRGAYHQFDMHADSSDPAHGGASVIIRGNWFNFGDYGTMNRSSIMIRGVPRLGPAEVSGNWFKSGVMVTSTTPTVVGVPGAVPSRAALRRTNAFHTAFAFRRVADGSCEMRAGGRQVPVLCAAAGLKPRPLSLEPEAP